MLIASRNSVEGVSLPYDVEVEYIEAATSGPYIDTGIVMAPDLSFALKGNYKYKASSVIGRRRNIAGHRESIYVLTGNNTSSVQGFFGQMLSSGNQNMSVNLSLNADYEVSTLEYGKMICNGQTRTTSSYQNVVDDPTDTHTMHIFCETGSDYESLQPTKGFLYWLKIYKAGVLVRDFIPVIDLRGVPCMYDKVSGKLFHNAGSGDFTAGPRK